MGKIFVHDKAKNEVCLNFEELKFEADERVAPDVRNRSKICKALNIAFIDMDVLLVPLAPIMSDDDFVEIGRAEINMESGVFNYKLTAHQEFSQDKYNAFIDEYGKIILRPTATLINNGGVDAGVLVHLKIEGVIPVKEVIE